ncbi:MAG: SLC13 family permease, partial [Chloroflexi bacterium]|nr:SLC13 family permease [Chloroflexota bacterium]
MDGQGRTQPDGSTAGVDGLVVVSSAFIINVGALAPFMPVAIRLARKNGRPSSAYLMPLAFGSLLGGMTTLTGTPPNIIIATFRETSGSGAFRMFDFTPVGIGVAAAGVIFVALIGWRFIPKRAGPLSPDELFQIDGYITEVRALPDSHMVDHYLHEIEASVEGEITILGLVRRDRRIPAASGFLTVHSGDVLAVRADTETLAALLHATGFELVGSKEVVKDLGSDEIAVMEVVVSPNAVIDGRSVRALNMRTRYGLNLLAVALQGANLRGRLASVRLRSGDVLMLQGS